MSCQYIAWLRSQVLLQVVVFSVLSVYSMAGSQVLLQVVVFSVLSVYSMAKVSSVTTGGGV